MSHGRYANISSICLHCYRTATDAILTPQGWWRLLGLIQGNSRWASIRWSMLECPVIWNLKSYFYFVFRMLRNSLNSSYHFLKTHFQSRRTLISKMSSNSSSVGSSLMLLCKLFLYYPCNCNFRFLSLIYL